MLLSSLVKGNESSQPDVPSFISAVLLLSRGPSFPGARASSPLSRSTTSPLWKASRHRFEFQVFRRIAFPHRRAFTAVPDLLGSRARFQALCLTPRFFEPRCRRTNSAFTHFLTHGHAHRTATLVRIDLCRCVSTQHRSPEGVDTSHGIPRGVAPQCFRIEARAPEVTDVNECDFESSWVGRPE